ncbi:MAG: peptidylprolyl isomerase [Oligoflexia bacterium]|nr:peptidylprolyl isomerase [Oligoflexia bacterium]
MKTTQKFLTIAAVSLFSINTYAAIDLAKIGSKSITDADMKNMLGAMPEGQKQQINSDNEMKSRLVDNLIVEELFVLEAEKTGVTKDKDYQTALERARRQLLAQRYLQKTVQPKLTDGNIKNFFEKNKTRYSLDEVHAYHVLLKTEAEANEVYDKAKKGEDFEVLAKKYSKDPSAAQNMGDLGFFTRARMVPQFSDAAFGLKVGEISRPVKTPFGYHVIKVVEKKNGKAVKYDEVKDQVKGDFQNESINDLIASLKKSNKVTVFEDKINGLKF